MFGSERGLVYHGYILKGRKQGVWGGDVNSEEVEEEERSLMSDA